MSKIVNRKVMFFDIDGTLLTEGTHIIPDSAKKAIKKARENGHLAFINTGRTFFNIEKELHDIGFDGYICGCGTYVRINNEVVEYKTLDVLTRKEIINHLRKHRVDAILEGLEDVYFDTNNIISENMKNIRDDFHKKGYGLEKNWDSEEISYDKLFLITSMETNIEEFISFFNEKFDYIDRGNNRGEVVPKGYSKATGIKRVLDYYNIPIEDAFVFGDSSNDLPMFEYVPNSIAMGESDECILKLAHYHTKNVEDDGIEYAMKKYGII
ncbi:HAD family hydrolase [Anaeromicropila herbilytica]|uniref:Hydrolase n=1 Tax=Anaeromicropila herbilytica TaxID=2785025 RepID=A0A7R7EKE8_9FIRM|nr:HAD family hydrolase [Anaeromicropila herbilytica]BCN30320.1 hydrolase [Anaeromicropila herbilytica]